MTRAAIYARYSSHAQNDESIEQQVAECEAYAAEHGMVIVARYADRAISGRTDRRPEFQRLLRDAAAHNFEVVIAYKSNRISRNMLTALQTETRLEAAGVRLAYCREAFGDNATGRFMLRTMLNLNQFYSENMSEDIQRGMAENARQLRVNGALPLGYRAGPDKRYEIDPDKAAVVREIFRRIAAGEQLAAIAADLNRRAIPTATGGPWNKGSFHRMTQNERYVGVYIYRDTRVEGGIPPILTRAEFDAARDRLHRTAETIRSRRRRPDMIYMLTGKLFCGECREPMHGTSGTSKTGAMHYYYRCRGCRHVTIRKDLAERLVIRALRECILDDATIDKLVAMVLEMRDALQERSEVNAISDRLRDTRAKKTNILRAIESGAHSQTLADRLAELEQTEAAQASDLRRAEARIPRLDAESVRYYFEQFRAGDVEDPAYQKLLIDTFLRAAYIFPDRVTVTFTFDGADTGTDLPIVEEDDGGSGDGCAGVRIGSPGGHHMTLIRTLRLIGRVFVYSVPREKGDG